MKKNFNQKLNDSKDMPKIIIIDEPASIVRYGGSRMVIAPPLAYDEIIKRIPSGNIITTDKIRKYIAQIHNADFTCPLTAGIFINIAAFANEERNGENETPFWRVLKTGGELNEKYPIGIEGQKMRLECEGHKIISKGKKYFVADFEKVIFDL